MRDTIAAVSSGQPPAAIAVIRVSGAAAFAVASVLAGSLPPPRAARVRALRDSAGDVLDHALVLAFPGPATATGEDLVELHCHGGRAVVAAVLAALTDQSGVRAAEPGEFTRRALTHGRIDLAEAEGLADLLSAETEAQRRAALAAVEGRVSRLIGGWMATVNDLSARVEAMLDYAEEDDVGEDHGTIANDARTLGLAIADAIAGPPVERLQDGIVVVLAGPPNAGKSTLLNMLVEREAAIVSPIAGTTRDRVEALVTRGGVAYRLTDTAGLTATDDVVEAMGVERAEQAVAAADLLVWLGDDAPPRRDAIWVHARADLAGRAECPIGPVVSVSHTDPETPERIWAIIGDRASSLVPAADVVPLKRGQRDILAATAGRLGSPSSDPLILAENLRLSRVELARILGVDATEAMLAALFSRFCLGK